MIDDLEACQYRLLTTPNSTHLHFKSLASLKQYFNGNIYCKWKRIFIELIHGQSRNLLKQSSTDIFTLGYNLLPLRIAIIFQFVRQELLSDKPLCLLHFYIIYPLNINSYKNYWLHYYVDNCYRLCFKDYVCFRLGTFWSFGCIRVRSVCLR